MSKYNVTFKQCGHKGTVELFGKCSERKEEIKMKRKVRARKTKRMFRKFWREWGITLKEFEMLLSACGIFMFPFLLRIFLAFFGI